MTTDISTSTPTARAAKILGTPQPLPDPEPDEIRLRWRQEFRRMARSRDVRLKCKFFHKVFLKRARTLT